MVINFNVNIIKCSTGILIWSENIPFHFVLSLASCFSSQYFIIFPLEFQKDLSLFKNFNFLASKPWSFFILFFFPIQTANNFFSGKVRSSFISYDEIYSGLIVSHQLLGPLESSSVTLFEYFSFSIFLWQCISKRLSYFTIFWRSN